MCGCPRFCKAMFGRSVGSTPISLVCQACSRGSWFATGRYPVRRTRSTSVQEAMMLAPRDWFPRPEHRSPCRIIVNRSSWEGARPSGAYLSLQKKTTGLRHPIILFSRHDRPDHARHLVGQGDRSHHSLLATECMSEPVVGQDAFADDPSDPAHRADDQQLTSIGLPHLADRAAPCLAAGRSLSWYQTQ